MVYTCGSHCFYQTGQFAPFQPWGPFKALPTEILAASIPTGASDQQLGPLLKALLEDHPSRLLRPRVHCWGKEDIKVMQLHFPVKYHSLHRHQSPQWSRQYAIPPEGLGDMDPKTPSP